MCIFIYTVIAFGGAALISEKTRSFYTPIVSLHGLLSLAWLALFAAQARFSNGLLLKRHRWLGSRSPVLVGAMIVVGVVVMIMTYQRYGIVSLLIANASIYLQFLIFFAAALIAARNHRADWHKRLMLLATISLLGPGHGRFVRLFGLSDEFGGVLTLVMLLGVPIAYDLLSEGRIRKPTVILIGISFAFLALTIAGIVSVGV